MIQGLENQSLWHRLNSNANNYQDNIKQNFYLNPEHQILYKTRKSKVKIDRKRFKPSYKRRYLMKRSAKLKQVTKYAGLEKFSTLVELYKIECKKCTKFRKI